VAMTVTRLMEGIIPHRRALRVAAVGRGDRERGAAGRCGSPL
jgi:hypothetical protein